jgi:hypothetical protein
MIPSAEQLLSIARNYWRSDKEYDNSSESPPEHIRLCELWEEELKKQDRWWAFLDDLEKELPDFTIGDATATPDASFRCSAYPASNRERPPLQWVVVGCVSILAPVYTVYGVRYEYSGTKVLRHQVFFEPLPPEMRRPADVIARKLESTFGVSALPREVADTPIPLIVHWTEPPRTTLFHALFTGQPERVP